MRPLSEVARLLLRDQTYASRLSEPLLLWECPPETHDAPLLLSTEVKEALFRPTARDPLVFQLRKSDKASNAFSMGITVGRTDNNDVVIDDNSVSRFHAYFQQDRKAGWVLVDAESKNGTWVDAVKLSPSKPVPVSDGAKIRVGDVDLVFLSPETFLARVRELAQR